jgi:hypothetical protein
VARGVFGGGHRQGFSRAQVKTCSVTWTLDTASGQLTVAERPAVMRANIVEAIKVSLDVSDQDHAIGKFNGAHRPLGDFVRGTGKLELVSVGRHAG